MVCHLKENSSQQSNKGTDAERGQTSETRSERCLAQWSALCHYILLDLFLLDSRKAALTGESRSLFGGQGGRV